MTIQYQALPSSPTSICSTDAHTKNLAQNARIRSKLLHHHCPTPLKSFFFPFHFRHSNDHRSGPLYSEIWHPLQHGAIYTIILCKDRRSRCHMDVRLVCPGSRHPTTFLAVIHARYTPETPTTNASGTITMHVAVAHTLFAISIPILHLLPSSGGPAG